VIRNSKSFSIFAGFPKIETSQMAASVDEMERLTLEGKLGPVKDGFEGWPEWSLAMPYCVEVIQNVSVKIKKTNSCPRKKPLYT
jgi:hypothetical protein